MLINDNRRSRIHRVKLQEIRENLQITTFQLICQICLSFYKDVSQFPREQACFLISSLFFQTALGYYLSGPKTTEAVMYITQHILQFYFSLKSSILRPLWLDNLENYSLETPYFEHIRTFGRKFWYSCFTTNWRKRLGHSNPEIPNTRRSLFAWCHMPKCEKQIRKISYWDLNL